jgi:hypothetical protein
MLFGAQKNKGTVPTQWLFPTRFLTSEDEYKWYWHQMIYFPETINTISTTITLSSTYSLVLLELCTSTYSVHAGISKPCRGRHPWPLVVFSRLLTSLVRAQLTLLVPALGLRPSLPQYGRPIHRVRAHSLTGIRNSDSWCRGWWFQPCKDVTAAYLYAYVWTQGFKF